MVDDTGASPPIERLTRSAASDSAVCRGSAPAAVPPAPHCPRSPGEPGESAQPRRWARRCLTGGVPACGRRPLAAGTVASRLGVDDRLGSIERDTLQQMAKLPHIAWPAIARSHASAVRSTVSGAPGAPPHSAAKTPAPAPGHPPLAPATGVAPALPPPADGTGRPGTARRDLPAQLHLGGGDQLDIHRLLPHRP